MESSDLMVKIAPAEGEPDIVIHSEVMKQFGDQIRKVVGCHAARDGGPPGLNHH